MYELTGTINGISQDIKTGKALLTLSINEKLKAMSLYDELQDKKLSIEVKRYREKRTLDSNAYFWVLADKLSAKLNKPKEEIYKDYIKDIGDNCEVVCVINEAVEKLCNGWQHNGIGWQTDTFPSKIEGCTNVILYYGSSTYDKAQMSRLIDNVVEDCKEQGIDVRTPDEIAEMLSLWGE